MTKPWGLQLTKAFNGGDSFYFPPESTMDSLYWNDSYRAEGAVGLQYLLDLTMNKEVFGQVNKPVFMGYYYKDEENQDPVVRVDAMLEMFHTLGTPDSLKKEIPFPDVGRHVMASKHKSRDWETVFEETCRFTEEILKIMAVND